MLSLCQAESISYETPTLVKCSEWCNGDSVVYKYSITWVIHALLDNNAKISSPAFDIGKNKLTRMRACFDLYPKGVNQNNKYMAIYLRPLTRLHGLLHGKIRIALSSYNALVQENVEMMLEYKTYEEGLGWGFQSKGCNNGYATTTTCTIGHINSRRRPSDQRAMPLSFLELLKDEEYADVTLTVCGEKLKAHKAILAKRSSVFAAMFKTDMSESRSGVIVIDDIEAAVMKLLLTYIYNGRLEGSDDFDNVETTAKLLRAAHKYDIADLKLLCEDMLTRTVDVENAVNLFNLALLYNLDTLRADMELFIRRNMDQVKITEGWKQLKKSSPDVIIEMFVESKPLASY